jgi:VanZ family protein
MGEDADRFNALELEERVQSAVRLRNIWLAAGWGLVAAIVYLSLGPPIEAETAHYNDKAGHLIAYFVLMLWFAQAVTRRSWAAVAAACVALGVALEFLQGMTGYREFSLADMLADGAGVVAAWWLACAGVNDLMLRAGRLLPARE